MDNYKKLFIIIIIIYFLYLLYLLKEILIIKENMKNKKKKKKKKPVFGSFQYIAKNGNVKGSKIGKNITMTAGGVGYGIYLLGDFVKYLMVDVPTEVLKLSEDGKKDPIRQIFG